MNSDTAIELIEEKGIESTRILFMVESGSTALGIQSSESDTDFTAIFIETWEELITGVKSSINVSTAEETGKSGKGDVDVSAHTLRKFANLILGANPTSLVVAFNPIIHHISPLFPATMLRTIGQMSVSARAFDSFINFMASQEKALKSKSKGYPGRVDLVSKFGYDTKCAAHYVRLGIQGLEYVKTGSITVPMKPGDARLIRDIKNGRMSLNIVMKTGGELERQLREEQSKSILEPYGNSEAVNRIVEDFYWTWYTRRKF